MATEKNLALKITSPAFEEDGMIPSLYTCDGQGINPPLDIDKLPPGTEALAIIAEDPDTAKGVFDHWIVWNIPPTTSIGENSNVGVSGINGAGKTGYYPPCPPSGSHRYYFKVYALDKNLSVVAGEDKKALLEMMNNHIIAEGSLMGRYQKTNQPKATP